MENEPQLSLSTKLTAIKCGIHHAFIEVYNELHVKVFRFYLKRVSREDMAKELTQQCFIRLWEFRHTLSESHPLEIQIFIIARSLLINHIRKEATGNKLKAAYAQSAGSQELVPDSSSRLEIITEVRSLIETLPPMRKKILVLKAFHGFSNREIATEMNISLKTVEDHVTKAFRHLKRAVTTFFFL
jgi:RNA polymerase sigma factor (sigma-70 family)